jgi:NAD(P)-dependent dehydrogenase (short-subunit alcohol dehydrogenase family)
MRQAGGEGEAFRVDHLEPDQVADLVGRIDRERGRLDLIVNDIFGGDRYAEWDKKLWEHDLDGGLRMLRMGVDTHLITCTKALPLVLRGDEGLVVEMTEGTSEFNSSFRKGVGFYYDLVKASVGRITIGLTAELAGTSCTAVAITPGWLRSERMLENFGVTEETWRDALEETPHFCISESPTYVARGMAALASDADLARHAGRVLSSAELARTYGVTDMDGTSPTAGGTCPRSSYRAGPRPSWDTANAVAGYPGCRSCPGSSKCSPAGTAPCPRSARMCAGRR